MRPDVSRPTANQLDAEPTGTVGRLARTTLVTGANGFIGSALVADLSRCGVTVRAAVRDAAAASAIRAHCHVVGDIGQNTDWSSALEGVDSVLHLAARAHQPGRNGSDACYSEPNTAGTIRLADSCARAGVRRLVFLSSVGVLGDRSPDRGFRETDPPQPLNPYAVSKLEAEQGLERIAQATGLETTIVRAPMVYGPDSGGTFGALLRWIKSRRPVPLAGIRSCRSFVGISNLSSFLTSCLYRRAAANQLFLISDDQDVEVGQFIADLARALGRTRGVFACPTSLLRLAAMASGHRDAICRLTHSITVDIARARRLLAWQPPLTVRAELYRIARTRGRDSLGSEPAGERPSGVTDG